MADRGDDRFSHVGEEAIRIKGLSWYSTGRHVVGKSGDTMRNLALWGHTHTHTHARAHTHTHTHTLAHSHTHIFVSH